MYNRYIPQSDGTYRRSRVADAPPKPAPKPQAPPPKPPTSPPKTEPENPCPPPKPSRQMPLHQPKNVDSFLKNLLPADFDTGDLIIILLLLLLAGDCQEDRNTALLTMMLYLFL